MEVMGWLSGFASSLPGMFINLLLMVITTFFIAADYELLTGFCLRQLGERPKEVLWRYSPMWRAPFLCAYTPMP